MSVPNLDTSPAKIAIEGLGHRGDGIATVAGRPVFVAGALPGEIVLVSGPGERPRLAAVIDASPDRVEPPCRHAARCGACVLQHAADGLYSGWKRDLLASALAAERIEVDIAATIRVAPGLRRRVTLALARGPDKRVSLGFHGSRDRAVFAVEACVVAHPAIVAALPGLSGLLSALAPAKGERDVTILATTAGLDVWVSGHVPRDTRRLAEGAGMLGLARLAIGAEVVATFRPPALDVGGVSLVPPPGGFVQAVGEAEDALAGIVLGHLAGARRALDLFSGAGAFALRLARATAVHAVEGDRAALAALDRGWRGAPGLKPVTTETRDLFRVPVTATEIARHDAVVIDPPRQGATAQAIELARSKVSRLAYVSCNPTSFARDAKVLLAGGWKLGTVTPVDQFLWSSHLELVATFER